MYKSLFWCPWWIQLGYWLCENERKIAKIKFWSIVLSVKYYRLTNLRNNRQKWRYFKSSLQTHKSQPNSPLTLPRVKLDFIFLKNASQGSVLKLEPQKHLLIYENVGCSPLSWFVLGRYNTMLSSARVEGTCT